MVIVGITREINSTIIVEVRCILPKLTNLLVKVTEV